MSVSTSGVQANDDSRVFYYRPALSADGRFVAFSSETPNLTSGDTNRVWDVFVHDFQTGTTERVSVDSNGVQASGASLNPCISADGRFVAFETVASLVPGDTNASWDIFVHDRLSGSTTLVSATDQGTPSNSSSLQCSISADGSRVAFKSIATNLVAGDGNQEQDVFLRDLARGTTERISVASDGTQANEYSSLPALSAHGKHVAFYSPAGNLVPHDTNGEATRRAGHVVSPCGSARWPSFTSASRARGTRMTSPVARRGESDEPPPLTPTPPRKGSCSAGRVTNWPRGTLRSRATTCGESRYNNSDQEPEGPKSYLTIRGIMRPWGRSCAP